MYQYKHQQLLARFIKISLKYHNISRFWEGGGVPPEKNTSCPPSAVKNASVMNTSQYAVFSCGEAGNVPRNIGRKTGREEQRLEDQAADGTLKRILQKHT